jgi:hypothetical protein
MHNDALAASPWKTIMFFAIVFFGSIAFIVTVSLIPDRWERSGWRDAVVIRVCQGGIPVVRLPDGSTWVRISWSIRYPVENAEKVCAP